MALVGSLQHACMLRRATQRVIYRGVVVPFPASGPLLEPEEERAPPFFVSWGLTVMSLVPKRVVERTAREQEHVCVVPGQVSPWKPVCAFQIGLDTP